MLIIACFLKSLLQVAPVFEEFFEKVHVDSFLGVPEMSPHHEYFLIFRLAIHCI